METSKNWKQWLSEGRLRSHETSRSEVAALRDVIARDLSDARIQGLSNDRRFATAYNAALQVARLALACAGYRLSSDAGHHRLAFEAAGVILGDEAVALLDYFDVCRRKRNQIDYFHTEVATDTEALELVERADQFRHLVERWIARTRPDLD